MTGRARHVSHTAALLILAVAVLVSPTDGAESIYAQNSGISYSEIAVAAGVENTWDGYGFGAGVAAEDLDVDGDFDLVILNAAGVANRIFENLGDRDGLGHPVFEERTLEAGLVDLGTSKGIVCADYNNDGLPDLFVTNYDETLDRRRAAAGYTSSITLYRNDGDFHFTDVTEAAGLQIDRIAAHGASAADIDNDGWLDLYVCNRGGIDEIRQRGGGYNLLFWNRGDGTFENISEASGIADPFDPMTAKLTFQSGFFDYDNDGDLDVYLATDKLGGNQLYRNNGDRTFTDVSTSSGADVYMNGMCVALGDYDNDLDLDVFITNTPDGHSLLRNNGAGVFEDVATNAGVAAGRIGWGARWLDVDHDAFQDLYVVHFAVPSNRNSLYHNRGNGTFVDVAATSGCDNPVNGFGLAEADFDLNGAPDFMVTNQRDACGMFVHDGVPAAWIRFKLVGTTSNRDAIGARLILRSGNTRQMREIVAGDSYLSHSATEAHFGLWTQSPDEVEIRWPSGRIESIDAANDGLRSSTRHRIVEGYGIQDRTLLVHQTVRSNAGVVQIDWETVQWPADDGFRVERSRVVDGTPEPAEVLAEISDAGRWHRYSDVVSADGSGARVYRYAVYVVHPGDGASLLFETDDVPVVPTPVTVEDWSVAATRNGIELRWHLSQASRADARAVIVQRAASQAGPWESRHELDPGASMQYTDHDVQVARDYWYRLLLESHAGVRTATLALSVRVPDGHSPRATLAPPVESPGGGPVRLSFTLSERQDVELHIVDARGRRVDTVVHGTRDPGMHVVSWDHGAERPVARGIYFVQLRAGTFTASRKLLVLQ